MPASKKIAIIGSTGSVGKQTLDVVRTNRQGFRVNLLSANNNAEQLLQQAKEFRPKVIVVGNNEKVGYLEENLKGIPVRVFAGTDYLNNVSSLADFDLLVNALSGINGLRPSMNAIRHGKNIAMANKESMVAGGSLIMNAARDHKTLVIPVDSEHSAIFQCLQGESLKSIKTIFLTASGGPFRGKKREALNHVTAKQALSHPNWEMGEKISIDSATLANKGLEAIAAQWYFELKPDQISMIQHPQSIVHALVQFTDGSLKAQLSMPDMRIPIHYALHFPGRKPTEVPIPDFSKGISLDFEKIDSHNYPDLRLALKAMREGGNKPAAFNAANETAVHAFLNEQISFTQIAEINENVLNRVTMICNPNLDEIMTSDAKSRKMADDYIKTIQPLNR